ncbi:MAG: response regulator transcription factor [Leptospiraceae bacterium]|nr:response regulator transcription factor [Leptospiraceae bacterium]
MGYSSVVIRYYSKKSDDLEVLSNIFNLSNITSFSSIDSLFNEINKEFFYIIFTNSADDIDKLLQFLLDSFFLNFNVIIILNIKNNELVVKLLKAGALAVYYKEEQAHFQTLLKKTITGELQTSPLASSSIFSYFQRIPFHLSSRENQILELLLKGKKVKEIAGLLSISQLTVKKQIQSIYKKTNSSNRLELFSRINHYRKEEGCRMT